ncbi:MAG: MarR family winged helix-turn-helix transcriptional regulator [Candidatus Marinimicrobia bacterium]|nr:MarR family winged helix-turn-helix transcriptional regulator [Candidatus Neomarinimicrobiota bacterium]
MSQAMHAMGRRLKANAEAREINMSLDQWMVMIHLWKKDGIPQNQLCHDTMKSKGSITRLIDTLEKKNFVVRVTSEVDSRVKLVYLTHEGKRFSNDMIEVMLATRDEAVDGINDTDISTTKRVLRNICNNLNKQK